MFGMSFAEIFLVFVVALVVLGPDKLPEAARWLGKAMRELRRASNLMRDTIMIDETPNYLPPSSKQSQSPDSTPTTQSSQPRPSSSRPGIVQDGPLSLDQIDEESFFSQEFDQAIADSYPLDVSTNRDVLLGEAEHSSHLHECDFASVSDRDNSDWQSDYLHTVPLLERDIRGAA